MSVKARAYYNEHDRQKAAWLRELVTRGLIAPGDVDERDIWDILPHELDGYTQCHFFAGIGVWSYALRNAGWPDDRPVWTGSCPCQPFSEAGKRKGFADERHLWPAFFHLIGQCRPPVVLGEQVESAIRHGWLDLVQADLEGCGYSVAAAGLPAAGFGAPHIRQRIYFAADTEGSRRGVWYADDDRTTSGKVNTHSGNLDSDSECERRQQLAPQESRERTGAGERGYASGDAGISGAGLGAYPAGDGLAWRRTSGAAEEGRQPQSRDEGQLPDGLEGRGAADGGAGEHLHPIGARLERHFGDVREWRGSGWLDPESARSAAAAGATGGFWADCDWWYGRDGKYRPIGPGLFPLAHGAAARVGRLRGYGDAIVAPVAEAFICAYMQSCAPEACTEPEACETSVEAAQGNKDAAGVAAASGAIA